MVPPLPSSAHPASADFARLLHQSSTEAGRLQRGVELVVALVDGCDHAGVTVLTPTFVETVAATDDVVRRSDGWQHELSEGPGLDAVRTRATVVSQDLRIDPRWRTWAPRAVEGLGVRSTLSVLLDTGEDTVGSLTLYADRVGVWDAEQQATALSLAGQLALATADARMLDDRQRAMVARGGMGQAQGIVMERFGMTAEEALDYLQRLSESTQLTLTRLAEQVVETREIPGPRSGEHSRTRRRH